MPVDQKDNEMRPDRQLTIATPFSARWYCLDDWLAALDAQTVARGSTELLWFVNTDDAKFIARIKREATKRRKDGWAKIRVVVDPTRAAGDPSTNTGKHHQVADNYRKIARMIETPFVLILESDVIAPPMAAASLMAILSMNPEYGAISGTVPYRHHHEPVTGAMVWDLTGPGPERKGFFTSRQPVQVSYRLPIRPWGTELVGATGFACLMVRTELFQTVPISAERMPALGSDQLFCMKLRERAQLAIHWDTRCKHYQELPGGVTEKVSLPVPASVDVVIPCTQEYAGYLSEVLASLGRQSYADGIASVTVACWGPSARVEKVCGKHSSVKFLKIPDGEGGTGAHIARARNAGAEGGTAPYLLFLDADDALHCKYLERQVDRLERVPWAAYSIPPAMAFRDSIDFAHDTDYQPAIEEGPAFIVGEPGQAVPVAGCLMRRSTWEIAGGYPEINDELWGFWLRCYEEGLHPVPNTASPPYLVRSHSQSASTKLAWADNPDKLRDTFPRAYQRPRCDTFVMLQNGNPFTGGGDSVQVSQTRDALWHLNIGADFRRDAQVLLTHYPVAHLFHIGDSFSLAIAQNAFAQRRPLVVSSIYHLPGPETARIAEMATVIVCASEGERRKLTADVPGIESKVRVIGQGVATAFLDPNILPPKDLPQDYLLCVGRFEPEKNQLGLLDALSGMDIPVVFVGPEQDYRGDRGYWQRCMAHSYPHKTFVGLIEYGSLPGYYRGAKAVACVSLRESYGLPLIEGQSAGCNLVVTSGSLAAETFRAVGTFCDPTDRDSIRAAVLAAMNGPRTPKAAPQTWVQVAAQYASIYRGIVMP